MKRPDRSPRDRRAEALRLLAEYDLEGAARWGAGEPRALEALQRVLSGDDERLRSRAAEALGAIAGTLAGAAPERVRDLVRRILWLMNDESGAVLWSGPEAIGAILARVPSLCAEFGPILASLVDEEPFRVGTRWALWRLARTSPETVRLAAGELRASLADEDAGVRGHAALALGAVGAALPELEGDGATLAVFDPRTGERRTVTVAEAASGRI